MDPLQNLKLAHCLLTSHVRALSQMYQCHQHCIFTSRWSLPQVQAQLTHVYAHEHTFRLNKVYLYSMLFLLYKLCMPVQIGF